MAGCLLKRGWAPKFRKYIPLPEVKKDPSIYKQACRFIHYIKIGKTLNVNSLGKVVPCCAHPCAQILGDLSKDKYSFILSSEAYNSFIVGQINDRKLHPICGRCSIK